jgi:hypothetical protein
MNKVILVARKNPTATISIVGAVMVCAVLLAVFAAGLGGGAAMVGTQGDAPQFGYQANPAATERFIGSLGKYKNFTTGAPDLFTEALPKEVLLWKAIEEASRRKFGREYSIIRQGIGDCVSQGWARGATCVFSVDYINGQRTDFYLISSESIYAGRAEIGQGSWSDGWYGSAAAKYVRERGLLYRKSYTSGSETVDLTSYSAQRAKQWGYYGLGGKAGKHWLEAEAAKHKVPEVALITTTGEAKAALANGYAIPVCSNVGFDPVPTPRDQNGVAKANGNWAHCMVSLGFYTLQGGETVFVIFNSWGDNASAGPGGPHAIPGGAFAIRERDMARILAARDSFAISGPNGFERRDIDHETWAVISPRGKDHLSEESEFQFAIAP